MGLFQELLDICKLKDGKLLSKDENIHNRSTIINLCCNKHNKEWSQNVGKILKGSWCRRCGSDRANEKNRSNPEETLSIAREIARKHNGELLSKEYRGYQYKLEWKCSNPEHESFKSLLSNARTGRWCPECADTKRLKNKTSEEKVRTALEILFNTKFPTVRPQWNTNQIEENPYLLDVEREVLKLKQKQKRPMPLELDGYSKVKNIGFEYDGYQHYELFSKGNYLSRLKTHTNIKLCDHQKQLNCKRQGVELIRFFPMESKTINTFELFLDYFHTQLKNNYIDNKLDTEQQKLLKNKFRWYYLDKRKKPKKT